MAEIPEKSMANVRVKGPFWSADVEVLKLAEPQKNWAFRNLFLDNTPRRGLGEDNLYLPGTLLVLCIVKGVKISPTPQQSYTWMRKPQEKLPTELTIDRIQQLLNAGNLSLLLIQASPEAWPGNFPQKDNQAFFPEELTCLAGEIHLDALKQQQSNAKAELYKALNLEQVPNGLQGRDKAARLLSEVSVHSSGLSIYGKTKLPWQDEKLSAPFQLVKLLPDLSPNNRQFRLTVERERLTDTERGDWSKAWKQLSTYLNPKNPLNGRSDTASLPTPNWVTLEIANPLDIPRLYWQISWTQAPDLKFLPDDINLLLSDQQPYDQKNPPTSIGWVLLSEISVIRRQNSDPSQELLEIVVNAGIEGKTNGKTLSYLCEETSGNWQESFTFSNLNVAFSPIEAPQFLRKHQELTAPERSDNDEAVSPAILWGFMPLENGWAQLPIPNLTEQIYLDSGLAKFTDEDEPIKPPLALIQGAVSIGNDRPEVLAAHESEQPWNITLTNARRLQEGRWVLKKVTKPDKTVEFQVTRITLNILDPEVTLNGIFWLSTGKPTPEDALPDLKNWISGLRSLPLKTVKPELDLFPSPVIIALEKLEFSLRSQPSTSEPPSALLKAWKFAYKAHEAVFGKMVEQKILPADTFSQYLPLIWQRHASLPMIQALPLTQTQSPPNYPSASRQLVPFELGTQNSEDGKFAVPKDWLFGVSGDNGAAAWPQLMRQAQPAREWQSLFDLPLVSLSIPGVILDPKANAATIGLPLDPATQLPVQYRFDLPYTDEINALAQLPKIPRNPEEVSPLPDSPPPQPPKPLTRETFAEHWQRLSELASLSSADATAAFTKKNEQTVIEHLIEPFDWPVKPTLNLQQYPGSLNLQNGATISLSETTALRGISGKFVETNNGQITGTTEADNPYIIEAGSMAARADGKGGFRDQRGLVRSATTATTKLVKTPVTFHKEKGKSQAYELISALEAINLQIGNQQQPWQIWFRDLPVRVETGSFTRQSTISEQAEDINDPEALSRDHNFLTGYEWRLAEEASKADFVSIFNLRFYPLTLEQVSIQGDHIDNITLVGRLQLPLTNGGELKDFNNAVRLKFERNSTLNQLKLAAIELEARPRPDSILPGTFKIQIDEPSKTWVLSWTGAMTPAQETALQSLPGDADFKLGINKLIKQVRQQPSPNPTATFTQAISFIAPGSEFGEWPLALQSGEASDAPRLLWKKIDLNSDHNRIDVETLQLTFFLFGTEWSVKLDAGEEETAGKINWKTPSKKLSFPLTEPNKLIEGTYTFPPTTTLEPLASESLKLAFDVASDQFKHEASLLLGVQLGRERVADGLQVLYTFTEGKGNLVKDVSGVGEPLNLTVENIDAIAWLTNRGLAINNSTVLKSSNAATKIIQACKTTNEITIEAWVKPARATNPNPGIPPRIVTLSQEGSNTNFSLQQGLWQQQASSFYAVRLRTTSTGNNGEPPLVTPTGSLTTDFTHVVYTKNAEGEARLYINGIRQANNTVEGDFSNWDDNYHLTLANELNRERPWQGEFHLVALYSCALSAAEVRQNYQAGLDTLPTRERSAFEAKVRFPLVGSQQDIKVEWESASLFRDMEAGVKDGSILFTENALQFQWSSYKPKYSDLQLLPGMHVTSGDAPGFAVLTFETEAGQGDIPKLRLKTAFIESLVLCQWGTFLQTNSFPANQKHIVVDEPAQVYGSSAGDLVFGYTAQWQKKKGWTESLLLNGFLEIKNLISWPKAMSIKSQGNLTKLILPPAQALNHIRHTIRILLNQHSITAELLVVGKDELLFQLARNQSWQFLAVVEHQLIDVLPGTQLTLENDRRWTTVQEVRLTLPETFRRFLLAQRGISTIDPVEGVDGLEDANSGYLAAKLRPQLAEGDTPELDKLSADTLLVEASAPHWLRKKAVLGASATTLQFLPNGSQQAILSNLQDYEPSDPQAPEWLLLTMPFLGRLQDKKADRLELLSNSKPQPPTNATTFSPLQVDPIVCLVTKTLPDLSLALNFSSWGNTANVEIAVSNLDTAVGRTWSRLDPLSLEENWFRLQNPLTEPKPTELQSVMAALPDTPARLSRSTALQHAFDAYRESYPPVTPGDNPPIQAVAISPDGQRAISGSDDGTLRFWDLQNGQLLQILKGHTDKVRSVAITPDRQRAVSGSDDGTVKFWDLDNGQVLQTLQGHAGKVRSVDITPDRQRAISGSDDGTVKVWNLDNGQVLRSLQGHTKAVTSVAITPDRQRAVSGSIDGTLKVWDVRNEQVLRTLQGHTKAVTSVAITPDRQRGVSGSEDGTVKFWDVENGELLQTLQDRTNQGHTHKVRSVAITPDRQRAVSGSDDGTVKLWDLNNGKLLKTLQGHSGGVGAVAITPDRKQAISGSDDGTVKLWDVENGEVRRTLQSRIDRVDVDSDRIVWRQNSLLAMQGVGSDRQSQGPAYNWYLTGLQLLTSGLLAKPENSENLLSRHAAATVLPALLKLFDRANPVPLSFAVSPYLGLEFKPAKISGYKTLLESTELLCLDKATGMLLPVASHFWEELKYEELKDKDKDIDDPRLIWAKETHLRLSPESPVAIVRSRKINQNPNANAETEALLTTTYSFAIASKIQTPQRLAKRVFRLRSTVSKLRFREGQFGGNQLPTAIHPFEIAPPQTTGVQPLYLTQRPKTEPSKTWPWGLSAIRLSVQYTEGKKAAIGSLGKPSGDTTSDSLALWWQAPQHMVQYRSASSANGPTAGLPPHFRATAIKSLLPVLPAPPLPSINQQETFNSQDRTKFRDEFQRWQPVLPGAVRYLMIGDRSGAMFAIRNQLLRQSDFHKSKAGAVMVSGSIPVQHRMPRPVPLPSNQNPDKALQTWASYFAEGRTHTLRATPSPADEAFFAQFGTPPNQQPARRLQMKLNNPSWGAINSQWDGELEFKLNFEENISVTDAWDIEVEVTDAGQRFKYQNTNTDKLKFRFAPLQKELLQQRLVNKAAGDTLTVSVKVKPKAATNNFSQTLVFQLHIVDPTALPLPLQPYFIHFEDPEYNRQLASPAAHASGNVSVQVGQELVSHTVQLSVDRREYNPDSLLSLRYDWDDNRDDTATLELVRINSDGAIAPLKQPANLPAKISSRKLEQWSLAEIQEINDVQLQQGDTLQLKLVVQGVKPVEIFLQVRIVQAPVIPATEAAYALLRQRTSQGSSVECVRFAWSPEATRVELVCAEDLRTEVVRRRAVFHWLDSVRLGTLGGYAIQKITKTGSTHFPTSQELEKNVEIFQPLL